MPPPCFSTRWLNPVDTMCTEPLMHSLEVRRDCLPPTLFRSTHVMPFSSGARIVKNAEIVPCVYPRLDFPDLVRSVSFLRPGSPSRLITCGNNPRSLYPLFLLLAAYSPHQSEPTLTLANGSKQSPPAGAVSEITPASPQTAPSLSLPKAVPLPVTTSPSPRSKRKEPAVLPAVATPESPRRGLKADIPPRKTSTAGSPLVSRPEPKQATV